MKHSSNKSYLLDAAWLFLAGIVSLGYVIFRSRFAECHIHPSFLDFPIFVGEITFLLSAVLLFFKWRINPPVVSRAGWVIIAYIAFVLVKAFIGYHEWGPLALRDSALFYYPLFAVFGYVFYNRNFFDKEKNLIILTIILLMFSTGRFDAYWALSCFFLGAILIRVYTRSKIIYILFVLFFLFTPYVRFFYTARMIFLGNLVSLVFLIISFYLIVPLKTGQKIRFSVLILAVLFLGTLQFSNLPYIRSILGGGSMAKKFNHYNSIIEVKKNSFTMRRFEKVRLYNPEEQIKENVAYPLPAQKSAVNSAKPARQAIAPAGTGILRESPAQSQGPSTFISKDHLAGQLLYSDHEGIRKGSSQFRLPISKDHVAGQIVATIEGESLLPAAKTLDEKNADLQELDRGTVNAVFRLFIWRDMIAELLKTRPLFGFDFGKPLRSISLEILGWAEIEWGRDGWVAAHNSYLHVIYRAGLVGILFVSAVFFILFRLIVDCIKTKSVVGLLLCGVIINWFVAAGFLLTFELPYTAIPIWCIYGMALAYVYRDKNPVKNEG